MAVPNLGIAIVKQYERGGVVFRWGGSGTFEGQAALRRVPLADRMWKVSLRTVTMPIASQQIITEDNVSLAWPPWRTSGASTR